MEHQVTSVIKSTDLKTLQSCVINAEGVITQDFYNWYLEEKGLFFNIKGGLIIEGDDMPSNCIFMYDFTDASCAKFELRAIDDMTLMYKFEFDRYTNLTFLGDLVFDLKEISIDGLKKIGKFRKTIEETEAAIKKYMRHSKKTYHDPKRYVHNFIFKHIRETQYILMRSQCCLLYCFMYVIYRRKPIEVTATHQYIFKDNNEAKSKYNYTGIASLRASKIYKADVPTDVNKFVRKFERHCEMWSVRGHQRTYGNGKVIWIGEHCKGQGRLHDRIYIDKEK